MASAPGLRVGDAEREATAASLREHFAEGRLTLEEFQHRLGAVFSAKTDRDLAGITGDLPHVAASPGIWPAVGRTGEGSGRAGGGPVRAGGREAWAGARQASAGGGERQSRRPWPRAVGGLIMIILAMAVVAMLLSVALFWAALYRSVLIVRPL